MNLLSEYHNDTTMSLGAVDGSSRFSQSAADHYDMVSDTVIELIASAGLGPESLDAGAQEISDDVQTLLQLALFRSPALLTRIQNLLDNEA